MISSTLPKWSVVMFTAAMAAPQYPMPFLQQYQPMINMVPVPPQPPPIQIPVPVPIPIGIVLPEETTTTTTTTTEKPHNENNNMVKIYLPWSPYFWQVPNYTFPKFPPLNLTIPSPNCQNLTVAPKCRQMPQPMPQPMPHPMPAPFFIPPHPAVIMIPLPPKVVDVNPGDRSVAGSDSSSSSSSSSDDSSDSSDSNSDNSDRSRSKSRKKKFDIFRRNHRFLSIRKSFGHIQPVLSYVSDNGDVKWRKRLSRKAAAELLTDTKPAQDIKIKAGNNSSKKSRVVVFASPPSLNNKTKKIVMRSSLQDTGNGNKEIVFKAPNNQKITNFSVSFRVER